MAEDWVDETAARVMAVIDDFKSKTEWPAMFEFMLAKAVSDLRIKLAEAERTIAELLAEKEIVARNAVTAVEDALKDIAKAEAERDEARRVAVWAARNSIAAGPVYLASPLRDNWTREHVLRHDGTDESIYAALRRAMGESDAD